MTRPRFLFIGGCPRSGTSAFADLLDGDSRFAIGNERFKFIHKEVGPEHFEPDHFFNPVPEETNGRFERITDLRPRWDDGRVEVLGDKVPFYYYEFDRLTAAFPEDTRFVLLVRDPLKVASSFNVRAWDLGRAWPTHNDYRRALKEWNASLRCAKDYVDGGGGDRLFILPYEPFFAGEELWQEALYRFIGLEPTDEAREAFAAACAGWEGRQLRPDLLDEAMTAHVLEETDQELLAWAHGRLGEQFEASPDPEGRPWSWSIGEQAVARLAGDEERARPPAPEDETDVARLQLHLRLAREELATRTTHLEKAVRALEDAQQETRVAERARAKLAAKLKKAGRAAEEEVAPEQEAAPEQDVAAAAPAAVPEEITAAMAAQSAAIEDLRRLLRRREAEEAARPAEKAREVEQELRRRHEEELARLREREEAARAELEAQLAARTQELAGITERHAAEAAQIEAELARVQSEHLAALRARESELARLAGDDSAARDQLERMNAEMRDREEVMSRLIENRARLHELVALASLEVERAAASAGWRFGHLAARTARLMTFRRAGRTSALAKSWVALTDALEKLELEKEQLQLGPGEPVTAEPVEVEPEEVESEAVERDAVVAEEVAQRSGEDAPEERPDAAEAPERPAETAQR